MIDDSQTSPRRGALATALRHNALLIVALLTIGTLAGVAYGLRSADEHTARASILIAPLEGNPFNPSGRGDDLLNLETEAQVVGSDPVARSVAERLGDGVSTIDLLAGLEVTVPPNTQILTIEYSASTDNNAIRRAQGFADSYLQYRRDRSETVVSSRSERIQDQVDAQNKALSGLVARSNVETNAANRNLLVQQINGVTTQIDQLQAQLAELQTGSDDPGQVITPADAVGGGAIGAVVLYGLLGLLASLGLGLGLVIVRARAENRIHHEDEVVTSGLPLLASISMNEVNSTNKSISVRDRNADIAIGEGLQSLRVAVLARERRRPMRVLYASAAGGSPSPRAALGLAYATASSSLATVLVDATNGARDITTLVGLRSKPGFTDVLAGDADLHQALTKLSANLTVLPAGRIDPRMDDLLTGPPVGDLFSQLGQIADVLIVATGPMRSPRAQALSMVTDVALVEAVESESRLADLVAIANDPTLAKSLLGVVFVERSRTRPHKTAKA